MKAELTDEYMSMEAEMVDEGLVLVERSTNEGMSMEAEMINEELVVEAALADEGMPT